MKNTSKNQQKLISFENGALNGIWDVQNKRNGAKDHRMKCELARSVIPAPNLRVIHQIDESKPLGCRSPGRPRYRWKNNMEQYLKEVHICVEWREIALNRRLWRSVGNEIKALQRLYDHLK